MKYRLKFVYPARDDIRYVAKYTTDWMFSSFEQGPHIILHLSSIRFLLNKYYINNKNVNVKCKYTIEPYEIYN